MEFIKIEPESGMRILKMLGVEPVCCSCERKITESNFGGIFGNKLVCNSEICIIEVI